jgi:hypothetical protein
MERGIKSRERGLERKRERMEGEERGLERKREEMEGRNKVRRAIEGSEREMRSRGRGYWRAKERGDEWRSKRLWWSTVSGYGSKLQARAGRKERQGAKGTFGQKCEE